MTKIHIFGSLSGTEPYPDRHHCSFAVEAAGGLYWFDAGENCSHTAHNMGLDVMKMRCLFISHPHIDHLDGLPGLIFTIHKIAGRENRLPECGAFNIVIPDTDRYEAAMTLNFGQNRNFSFPHSVRTTRDGILYDDCAVRVEAYHNHHLPHEEGTPWRSFSFKITVYDDDRKKTVVYSGDVKHPSDCENFLRNDGNPVDLFLMESGHHNPPEVAKWLIDSGIDVGRLCFIHHGRHLLDKYAETVKALHEVYDPRPFTIGEDAMTIEI